MTPARKLLPGLLLTGSAGYIDAVGFIELGGVYTSFMSGNTTQFGDALATGTWSVAVLTGALIGLFFGGSVMGGWLALTGPHRGPIFVLGFVLLTLAATLGLSFGGFTATQAMLALAAGAGAQNAILISEGGVRLGATFVTGTLFAAGNDLARALRHQAPLWRWTQHLLVWASLLIGAALGAMAYRTVGIIALLVPAAAYGSLLIWLLTHRRPT